MAHNFPQILSALLPSRKTSHWGMRLQATLVTYVFRVFLVHAPTTQTALQSLGLLKGNGHFQEAEDQKQNQTAEGQESLHLEFCSALGHWGVAVAGRVLGSVCKNCTKHLGNPWGEDFLAVDQQDKHCNACCWLHAHNEGRHH